MKKFKELSITGDILSVICKDTESREEKITYKINLTPFYFAAHKDLEFNVFSTNTSWLFDDEDELPEDISNDAKINKEFLENFCCDVPDEVVSILEENEIIIDVVGYEDEEDEHERRCYYIENYLEEAIKKALNLNDSWQRKKKD